ncbi:MAG: ATP-binding protein [Candidatus Melainabacteria bacterium]|nr:MAG: ATP-binding protein [Candidatus Melainabacteria bacterium]
MNGPRQCGKTTLAKELVSTQTAYRTLDDLSIRELAQNDPRQFVEHDFQTLVIDEIQRVPDLLSSIKMKVDEDTRPGQFLLTGSANIQTLPNVTESMAGRIRKLRLRPLTQGEILQAKPTFLNKAFEMKLSNNLKNDFTRSNIMGFAMRGGFPEVFDLDSKQRKSWHRDYTDALLTRDLSDITRINRQDSLRQLLDVLAAWSSKQMQISNIGSGLSITRPTVESYINALETLFLIERVKSWTKTDYDRVGKHPKIFMTDSGLMASTLGWREEQVSLDPDRIGKLFETFIFNELAAQIDASEDEYTLFHYRDREQREIDFLVERDDGALLGIEIKSGSAVKREHFKHLQWFKENLAGKTPFIGIVLYSGNTSGSMGDGMWAIPIGSLWA